MTKSSNIFISQATKLSGLEYALVDICNSLPNSYWIILSNYKIDKEFKAFLFKKKIKHIILYSEDNIFNAIPILKHLYLLTILYKIIRNNKNPNIFATGLFPCIYSNLLPIHTIRKYLILRNDIRRLGNVYKKLLIFTLFNYKKIYTNSIFNYRYLKRKLNKNMIIFTFDCPKIKDNLATISTLETRKEDNLIITAASSMRPVKNPHGTAIFINKICSKINKVHFRLIGYYNKDYIEPLLSIKSLNKVTFYDYICKEECHRLISSSNYFLSLSSSEGAPNSVIEAMKMNIPCILSEIEAHAYLSRETSNYLIKLNNLEKEIEAFVKVLISQKDINMNANSSSDRINHLERSFPTLLQAMIENQ